MLDIKLTSSITFLQEEIALVFAVQDEIGGIKKYSVCRGDGFYTIQTLENFGSKEFWVPWKKTFLLRSKNNLWRPVAKFAQKISFLHISKEYSFKNFFNVLKLSGSVNFLSEFPLKLFAIFKYYFSLISRHFQHFPTKIRSCKAWLVIYEKHNQRFFFILTAKSLLPWKETTFVPPFDI